MATRKAGAVGPGFDEHIARQTAAGAVEWYAADHLGSVRLILDNSGSVTGTLAYDAFGEVLSGTVTDIGYAGYRRDSITSLDSVRAREYDPGSGMWYSEDPLGLGPDANPFRYVGNSVTNATDPSGMFLIVPRDEWERWWKPKWGHVLIADENIGGPDGPIVRLDIAKAGRTAAVHNAIAEWLSEKGVPGLGKPPSPWNDLHHHMDALYDGGIEAPGPWRLDPRAEILELDPYVPRQVDCPPKNQASMTAVSQWDWDERRREERNARGRLLHWGFTGYASSMAWPRP